MTNFHHSSPQAVLIHVTGSLLAEARNTMECVGESTDPFAISERSVSYGLLLQVREWLMSPPVEQATPYGDGPHDGGSEQLFFEQVERFKSLTSREQHVHVLALGSLLQSAHDDLVMGTDLDDCDRPVATARFLSPRVSHLLHGFFAPVIVAVACLAGAVEVRAAAPTDEVPAIFSQQIAERWTKDAIKALPANARVAVAPLTWPDHAPLIVRRTLGKDFGADGHRRNLINILKREGIQIVEPGWNGWDVLLMGGISDFVGAETSHASGALAWLFAVQPTGQLTIASRVNVAVPVWDRTAPYDLWTWRIRTHAQTTAAGLLMTGHRRVAVTLAPIDPDAQGVSKASGSVHRVWFPLIVEALTQQGIEVYIPHTPGGPLTEVRMAVEWPETTGVRMIAHNVWHHYKRVHGATLHTWIASRRGETVALSDPFTIALPWPYGATAVERVEQLTASVLAIPDRWNTAKIRPLTLPPLQPTETEATLKATARAEHVQREQWLEVQLADVRKKSAAMSKSATARIVGNWDHDRRARDQAWAASPSHEVPASIRTQAEKLHRHTGALEDALRTRMNSVPLERTRPYPQG